MQTRASHRNIDDAISLRLPGDGDHYSGTGRSSVPRRTARVRFREDILRALSRHRSIQSKSAEDCSSIPRS
ncbi:hypothetical protein ABTM13_20110, partial [Acinetobacter baumannii]